MTDALSKKSINCDLCVIGGGLSGSFAALEAARHGAKVVLMQDRPVLGGNASSEIRMWVRGAKGVFDRETGLISELEEGEFPAVPESVFADEFALSTSATTMKETVCFYSGRQVAAQIVKIRTVMKGHAPIIKSGSATFL